MKEKWIEETYQNRAIYRRQKFKKALKKAMQWQEAIGTERIRINGKTYFGPHKWIICLLGSDVYPVDDFIKEHGWFLKFSTNLNISAMALSEVPLDSENQKDYQKLCNLTKEGMFVNILNSSKEAD